MSVTADDAPVVRSQSEAARLIGIDETRLSIALRRAGVGPLAVRGRPRSFTAQEMESLQVAAKLASYGCALWVAVKIAFEGWRPPSGGRMT